MRSGPLRHRLVFYRKPAVSQDSYGADTSAVFDADTWTKLCSQWGKLIALQGRELDAVQQTWAEARFKGTMHNLGYGIKRADVCM